MHRLSTGLGRSEPPVSPETIGRAPSNFDAAVPLRSLEELVGIARTPEGEPSSPIEELPPAAAQPVGRRRLVVRLLDGDCLELGSFDTPEAASDQAKRLAAALAAAEATGEWPELDGRFLRPASIVSVDVLS
jgi:hypothetical protein